jgi:apolipoprotein N-acyltransferase
MNFLAARLAGTRGWRRALFTLLLGAVATLALPPISFTPALLVAFTGFVWILDGSGRAWRAALDGWWFGFGFLVTGLYWIAYALLTDASQFAWLIPFAVAGVPALLAFFTAAAALLAYLLWRPGAGRVVVLAVAWTAAEWLRGHLFTGFPWNLVGYTWTWSDAMLQTTSVLGIYGLSFLTVLVAAAPAAFSAVGGRANPRGWPLPAFAVTLVAAGFVYGFLRLAGADGATVADVTVRIVQANIAQSFKWEPDQLRANVERHLALTRSPGIENARVVVWPETAMPYDIERDGALRSALGGLVAPDALLVTGVPRYQLDATGRFLERIWNSIAILDSAGAIVGTYDKAHLVPFGEYVPLRALLDRVGLQAINGFIDHTPGPGLQTLALPGLPPVSPLICYEVIFPAAVTAAARPAWLLNVTNDGWYGGSAGPYQHFAMARVRAVEEGLPLVRAANTGISGVVDGYGRVRASLGLLEHGIVDAPLPVALAPTFYARFGDLPVLVLLSVLGALFAFTAIASSRTKSGDR